MKFNIAVGIGAGLASAVLFLAVVSGNPVGVFVTLFLSPLALAIAGLGWGAATALLAAFVGALVLALVLPPLGAVLFLVAIALPTVGFTYLLLLNRDVTDANGRTATEWYPMGRVIAVIAFWAGGLAAVALLSMGTDVESIQATMRASVDSMLARPGLLPPDVIEEMTPERRETFSQLLFRLMPFAMATLWSLIAVFNLWLAAKIVNKSGQLQRPWPQLNTMVLPGYLNIVFAVCALASFAGGIPGLAANCMIWAVTIAYLLQGLAIVHQVSRGVSARVFILAAVYTALMWLQPFSSMAVALLGIAEPISPLKRKYTEAMGPPPPPSQGGPGPQPPFGSPPRPPTGPST